MSEFKLTGNLYVSQWNGSSLNTGTEISPYAHPADAPVGASNIIIGTGFYVGSWTGRRYLYGDGKVIIDLQAQNFPGFSEISTIENPFLKNIDVRNCGFFLSGTGGNGASLVNQNAIVDCKLQFNTFATNYRTIIAFVRCFFKTYTEVLMTRTLISTQNRCAQFYNCMFFSPHSFDGSATPFLNYQSCYFNSEANFVINYSGINTGLNNNIINSKINWSGTEYQLKKLLDGSPRPDADPLIPDFVDVYPNIYTNGNFASQNIQIVDVEHLIVSPESDLLKKSNGYGYIGGVKAGKKVPVNSSDPDITISTIDIDTSNPNNYLIQSPANEGFIYIIWKISDNISEVQRILLDALLSFDGSEVGGSVGNNNVPDNFPASYSPLSQPGLKPNRLLYELRTSQSIGKPTIDAEWDNDNVSLGATVGAYYRQEWNTKPTIVTVLGVRYGNGNPESIGGVANGINARWAQAKIRLTNNRAF